MKAVLDVHYMSDRSVAACIIFSKWQDSSAIRLVHTVMPVSRKYHPGRFYERELPCLLSVLETAEEKFESIIIDGYVHLRQGAGKGLGVHLSESLPYSTCIIGVSKKWLKIADSYIAITRGWSKKPLYVSAIGCSLEDAAQRVTNMHGPYRIPTLLRLADHYARSAG